MVSSSSTPAPNVSGNQPPSAILIALADRNTASTASSSPNTASASARGQRHSPRATRYANSVVTSIVPDTAMPYAEARPDDERNVSTSTTTATSSAALIAGT